MNEAPREEPGAAASVLLFIGGMGLFWIFDIVASILTMSGGSVVAGLIFLAVVLAGAVSSYRGGLRSLAAGIVVGYAVVGILSGGNCILFGRA